MHSSAKKIFILAATAALLPFSAFASSISVTPSTVPTINTSFTITSSSSCGANSDTVILFDPVDGSYVDDFCTDSDWTDVQNAHGGGIQAIYDLGHGGTAPIDVYTFYLIHAVDPTNIGDCYTSYTACQGELTVTFTGSSATLSISSPSGGGGGGTVNPSIAVFSLISASSSNEMIAGVGAATQDTGLSLWKIVAIAISVPLSFYLFEQFFNFFRYADIDKEIERADIEISRSKKLIKESKKY